MTKVGSVLGDGKTPGNLPPPPRGLAGNQGAEPKLTGLSRRRHELSNICHVTWIWIASNTWQMKRNTLERNKTRGL